MEWNEIKLHIPAAYAEQAGAIASMTVPYGYYLEDYSSLEQEVEQIAHIDLIDSELLARERDKAVIHLYIPADNDPSQIILFLKERLTAGMVPHTVECSVCDDEDWTENWKKYFKPMDIGRRLHICPAWEAPANPQGRKVLKIEPGAAFGSGTHETTRLCLEALDRCVTQSSRVLDVGCGSGILSIAALLLGAQSAVGVDIDALAVKTARENGRINGFEEPRYTVLCGSLASDVHGSFDIIAANIVADVIISFIPDVRRLLKPDGLFVMSGIIDSRTDEVTAQLDSNNYELVSRCEDDGWVCLTAKAR